MEVEDRRRAWVAGEDENGPLRGARKNFNLGTGDSTARRRGETCHDLGNPCYMPHRTPGCREYDSAHRVSDCPNKDTLVRKL